MEESDRKREDQWFAENERRMLEEARHRREKRAREMEAEQKAEERKRRREAHFMKCPKCGADMKEEDLQGIRVDRCSECEGLYFDAGELDQVMLKRDEDRKGFFRKLVKL